VYNSTVNDKIQPKGLVKVIYGLIEVTPENKKKKIIIISIIAVCVLIIGGIVLLYKTNFIQFISQKKLESENSAVIAEQTAEEKEKQKHIASVSFLPVYTEETKSKLANIYSTSEKTAYLTFDDGPSQTVTPLILDLLKQENIKATFFVLGSRVELNPSLVKREYEEGHFIANHGYSHIYANIYTSTTTVLEEYNKTQQAIQNALGIEYNGHLFRFPGGSTGGKYASLKKEAKALLDENEIGYIDWNALSSDAAGAKTKEALMENIIQTVGEKSSVVILMHDAGDKILTYEVLPDVIAYLREKGYVFKNFYDVMN
jgi:peptidoglycan/xylan/chitin deacetylase (PgdA/CDA1 family)